MLAAAAAVPEGWIDYEVRSYSAADQHCRPSQSRQEIDMTKINLFLSVAMTALLIGGAARGEVTLARDSTLVGNWCAIKLDTKKLNSGWFKRGECGKDDGDEKRLSISRRGFEYLKLGCQFIDKKPLENGIEVLAECSVGDDYQFTRFAVEFITKDQIQTWILKTIYQATPIWEKATCFTVKKDVPLGYLNLREGPGMEFKVRDKLAPRQDQLAAMVQTKDGKWARVIRENGDKVAMEGWVYQDFLDEVECKPGALPTADESKPWPNWLLPERR